MIICMCNCLCDCACELSHNCACDILGNSVSDSSCNCACDILGNSVSDSGCNCACGISGNCACDSAGNCSGNRLWNYSCDLLCVTNRLLCQEDFLQRIEKIASCHPAGIILREKDLSESKYEQLARQVLEICKKYQITCILHSFVYAAVACNAEAIHLPLHILREMDSARKAHFKVIGASCHSVEDALEAEQLGCTYITAGHIFATDCKKGLPGRGLDFLQKVCKSVSIPVYAIGGIDCGNIAEIRKAGAKGACVMSGAMQCEDVEAYIKSFYK